MAGWWEILPYIEGQTLYDRINSLNNGFGLEPWLECPSDDGTDEPVNASRNRGLSSYGMCVGDNMVASQIVVDGTEERNDHARRTPKGQSRQLQRRRCSDRIRSFHPIAPYAWSAPGRYPQTGSLEFGPQPANMVEPFKSPWVMARFGSSATTSIPET